MSDIDALVEEFREQYVAGGWGPHGQYAMLARDGRTWRRP